VTALAALAAAAAFGPAPARAAPAPEFPAGYEGYHTYAEMVAAIDALVAARPGIVAKRAVGRSHEGRTIWAIKVSDNVATDEAEPEVLFESLSHAREHLTVEQALRIAHLLADNYRARTAKITTDLQRRATAMVKTREIWIVPMVNPDGGEYDIRTGSRFEGWRKNRQPIPGSTAIGIDLNRNWGFNWGCCKGSSGKPGSQQYRGPSPWYAPEVAALRDFVLSRRVGGVQQIRAAISWHAFNEEIMWPYGYTRADLPRTMTADDLAAFRAVGRGMAARNGYAAKQMSDLYIMDGGVIDWLYGDQRIFAFTIEMYPTVDVPVPTGFYPADDVIQRETTRNDDAVLYFLEQAGCFHHAAGLTTRCGPLDDDLETGRGWSFDAGGSDTATDGAFERGSPQRTATGAGLKQPRYGFSGLAALVSGASAGSSAAHNDIDGGVTSATSPAVRLGQAGSSGWRLQFRYSFAHEKATSADYLRVLVNGTEVFSQIAGGKTRNAAWRLATINLDAFAGEQVRVTIKAADGAADSLVEAVVDDVRIYRLT
jgi:hypothetical protein